MFPDFQPITEESTDEQVIEQLHTLFSDNEHRSGPTEGLFKCYRIEGQSVVAAYKSTLDAVGKALAA